MKQNKLTKLKNEVKVLTKTVKQLIEDLLKIDSLTRGTLTAFQLHIGEKEWKKVVEELDGSKYLTSEVWDKLLSRTLGNTGYTHQWKNCDTKNSTFNMASVDTLEEKRQANKLGYRTFRTRLASEPVESDEVVCLSDKVAREGKTLVPCSLCKMCSGTNSQVKKNITIIIH